MNKTRFHIMPGEMYIVKVGNHDEEILGEDILAILEAAFDEAAESKTPTGLLYLVDDFDYES